MFADFGIFYLPGGSGGTVIVDSGMQIIEEMGREEAAKYDGDETSGAHDTSY